MRSHIKTLAIVVGTGSVLGACSFSADALWSSLTCDALWSSLTCDEPSSKSDKKDGSAPQTASAPALVSQRSPPPADASSADAPPPALGTTNLVPPRVTPRRPLVVIRFDGPNVEYAQALYNAVSRALERRPSATFDLVAVAPNSGNVAQVTVAASTSKRNAESVLRSLSDMGLPLDRVRLSAMTSGRVAIHEVHIYVR